MIGSMGKVRFPDKRIIALCIVSGIIAGLLPILRGVSWLYIGALMGIGIFGFLLAYRYHWMAMINILLLSVVKFEPAPSDMLFIPLSFFGFIMGHLEFSRLKSLGLRISLMIIYSIIGTLQLFFAWDKATGIKYHLITIYLMAFCLYILLFVSRGNFKGILKAYIISSSISAILGLSGYGGLFSNIFMYDKYRIMGFFKDPNVLGPFLVPTIIILLDDVWKKELFCSSAWIHISLIIINVLGVIATFSRGAWVNILVCLLVYFALNIKKIKVKNLDMKRVLVYGLLGAIVLSMVWGFIIGDEYKQFLYARINLQSYDKDRFSVQRKGVSLVFINILGYGPGQFEYNVLRETGVAFSAHNLYIRLMMENGIIGFIAFLGNLALILYKLIVDHKQGKSYIAMTPACLVAILSGILINSLVIDTLHWRHFWFFIGLSMASFLLEEREKSGDKDSYKLESGNTLQRDMEWYLRGY